MATALVMAGGAALIGPVEPAQAAFPGQNGRIAYVGSSSDVAMGIYTVSPTGGSGTLTVGPTETLQALSDPTFSPDGKRIAFGAYDGNDREVFTVPVSGGTPTNVTNNSTDDYQPTWSPNGRRIAYSGKTNVTVGTSVDIYTIPSTGGTRTKVSRNNQSTGAFNPAWSPDGTKIAYDGDDNEGDSDWEVFTVPVSGGTPTNVTNNSTDDYQPAWSPDSKTIVYQGRDPSGKDQEILTKPAAGGTPTNVTKTDDQTDEGDPAFSPDGNAIAYVKSDQGYYNVYKIPVTGGTPSVLFINNTIHNFEPDWGVAANYGQPMVTILDQNFIQRSTIAWNGTNSWTSYRAPVGLNWSATDSDGIVRYQLQQSTDGGAYQSVSLSAPAATSTTLSLLPREYTDRQFRVRAQDSGGNWGPWVVGPRFRVNNYKDDNPYHGVTYPSGDWKTAANKEYYGGVLHYARYSGTAQFSFKGRSVGWVGTTSPGGGRADVYVDGVYQNTVYLYSSTEQHRKVLFTYRWASWGPHTVTIRLLPGNMFWSHKPVTVDDFVVLE